MKNIFNDIPCILQKLTPADFMLTFAGDDDVDNDDDSNDEVDDNSNSSSRSSIPDNEKVINLHLGILLEELTTVSKIRINPLAQVLSEKDLQSLGWNNNSYEKSPGDELYVVHSGFGNEYLESLCQKSIVIPSELTFAIPHLFRFMKIVKESLFPSKQLFSNSISNNEPYHHIYTAMKLNSITVEEFMLIGSTNNNKENKKNYEKKIFIFLTGFIKAGLVVLED
jgi:hypothetical protein